MMLVKIKILRRWIACGTFILLIWIDVRLITSMPDIDHIAYGRVVVGMFLQLICVAYIATFSMESLDFTKREQFPYRESRLLSVLLAMVIPTFLFGWMGTSLVFKGLHEAHVSLLIRGSR